jgi:hypothetical protein
MAVVYRDWDLRHDRAVAIKVLRPELADALACAPGSRRWWADNHTRHCYAPARASRTIPCSIPANTTWCTGQSAYQ